MAYGDTPYDGLLKQAWEDFCDGLKSSADLIFRDNAPSTALARAEGFRYLSRYISRALNVAVEFNDPLFPQFWRNQEPTRKYGGDNPDGLNLRARIDGEHTYRIVGNRGNAVYVAFTVLRNPNETPAGQSTEMARLLGPDLTTEWDGSYELVLSPDRHTGSWIETRPGAHTVSVRQFFGDWESVQPMTVRIERVGAEGPPAPLTPEAVAKGLREASQDHISETARWAEWIDTYRDHMQTFVPRITVDRGGAPGKAPLYCYWRVEPDEALLIEVTPPRALWWNFELNNYWMNSLDYRYHLSSLNSTQAVLEDDGLLRIALAHEDPGVANWLETGGHSDGRIGIRWVLADSAPVPATRLVKLADLPSLLPTSTRRITLDERREQIRRRRIGVDRRFRV